MSNNVIPFPEEEYGIVLDRKFFNQFPERKFYIRHSTSSEIRTLKEEFGFADAPEGMCNFTVCRNLTKGVRIRKWFVASAEADPDTASEEAARYVWEGPSQ
jgi:hypothetical protein